MPRAFLVKKTRGTFLDKFRSDYGADRLDVEDSKSSRHTNFRQIQNVTLFEHGEALPDVRSSNHAWHISQTSPFSHSDSTASSEVVDLAEPMDLSQVNSMLRVSSTSAFEQVGRNVRVTVVDDAPTSLPSKQSEDICLEPVKVPISATYGHEPLDLHVRRQTSRNSPHSSCGTVSPDESVPSFAVAYKNTHSFHQDRVQIPSPASALHSLNVDRSISRQTGFFQDAGASLSQYAGWINAASDTHRRPYCKQERTTVLPSNATRSIKQDRYDMTPSYLLDSYVFSPDIDSHTDDYKMPTISQKPTDMSPERDSTIMMAPHMPKTDSFLIKQVAPSRRSEYLKGCSIKHPRQPVLGLEYVQNMPNIKDIDCQDGDNSEPKESGLHGTDINSKPDPELSPILQENPGSIDVGVISTRDTLSSMGKANTIKPTQLKKYMCDVCGKGFSRSNTLVTHKRIHTGDKPFKCELCGRAFRQPGNLTRHRLTHTTVKPYICQQCGKAFNRASNLHTHMRTHTNYKPFVCQYCGKGFHQKIDMKIHSYTHTGEKPHKCKKCGRGFKQLTHLTYHMRTHSEIKMYTCAYCGKGFNQKGNLQAHIYGHTGERPYHCEICNKGFTLASTLNTHRRTHADKKPYACQYCGKDFYQKNALKSHMIASHPYTGKCLL